MKVLAFVFLINYLRKIKMKYLLRKQNKSKTEHISLCAKAVIRI